MPRRVLSLFAAEPSRHATPAAQASAAASAAAVGFRRRICPHTGCWPGFIFFGFFFISPGLRHFGCRFRQTPTPRFSSDHSMS